MQSNQVYAGIHFWWLSISHADSIDSATASMSSYAEVSSPDAPRPVQIVVSKPDHTFDLDHEALQVAPSPPLPLSPHFSLLPLFSFLLSLLHPLFLASHYFHHILWTFVLPRPHKDTCELLVYVGVCCDDLCVCVSSQLCPGPAHGRTHWDTAEPHEPNHTLLPDSCLNTTI